MLILLLLQQSEACLRDRLKGSLLFSLLMASLENSHTFCQI